MKQKILLLSLVVSLFGLDLSAQVAKKVVVEHFTNTRCGICASRNPSFYNNLGNHPNILHLSIHPSSPYSNCLLYQHNPTENDGRTNYYGVYGSTPRLVIQGNTISSGSNYSVPELFDPYEGLSSPVSIAFQEVGLTNNNEVRVKMTIKTEADHSLGDLKLFVALAEDTLFYNAPNGEDIQFDVFRKAMTAVDGDNVILPALGETINFTFSVPQHGEWIPSRIYPIAILQEAENKAVVQSAAGPTAIPVNTTGLAEVTQEVINFYPNPVNDLLYLQSDQILSGKAGIYNHLGQLLETIELETTREMDMNRYASGIYFVKFNHKGKALVQKVIKE